MMKRAENLTDIYNLFKPMALKAEQSDFYQETASVREGKGYEFHDGLYKRIKKAAEPERLLIVGHGGCGKSTELHMLKADLSAEGYPVVYIDAKDDLNLYNFTYIDLIVLIVEKMASYADINQIKVNEKIKKGFYHALCTKETVEFWKKDAELAVDGSVSLSAPIPFLQPIIRLAASLRMASGFNETLRQVIKPKIEEVISSLNAFVEELQDKASQPLTIVIDGLEKCRHDCVQQLFMEDIPALARINAHLLIACPIAVFRSSGGGSLSSYFSAQETIPMIKTHNEDGSQNHEGIRVIKELILKRSDESFYEEDVLNIIISKSGGSLRDTCFLLSESAFEADMLEKNTVDMDAVKATLKRYATDIFFRVDARYFPRMKKIYTHDHTASIDEDLEELLYARAVFEYNGDRWVDLYPLLRDYIDRQPEVLGS